MGSTVASSCRWAVRWHLEEAVEPSRGTWGDVQALYDEGVTLILLSGEIDLALGPELEAARRTAADRPERSAGWVFEERSHRASAWLRRTFGECGQASQGLVVAGRE
jgi:hypothetical protein